MVQILWLIMWPVRKVQGLLNWFTTPIPFGLWIVNVFCQRLLGINKEYPFMVHFTSRVIGSITVRDGVCLSFAVSGGCYIQGINGIEIGENTIFAPGVKIISANHAKNDYLQWNACDPIRIGRKCWIGANAVILPGVQLGDNVTVGAGSVVTKSFESNSVIAGVPAKKIANTGT